MKALIPEKVHQILIDKLSLCGVSVTHLPDAIPSEIDSIIGDYDILIVRSKFKIDAKFISKAAKLKIIGRYGAGLEGIDIKECDKKGIKVVNSPEGNRNAVAEHAVGLILSLLNKICKAKL